MTRVNPAYRLQDTPDAHQRLCLHRAAAVCGVSPHTFAGWIAQGRGPVAYQLDANGSPVSWSTSGINRWRYKQQLAASA